MKTLCASSLLALRTAGLTLLIAVQQFPLLAHAGDQVGLSRTQVVSLADLDLSTPAGAEMARARVRKVAGALCAHLADAHDRSRRENFITCVESATANAFTKLEALARRGAAPGDHAALANHFRDNER